MRPSAKIYVYSITALGAVCLAMSVLIGGWTLTPLLATAFLACVVLGSCLKIRLPGVSGTYSPSFLPILFGLTHFGLAELAIAAAVAGITQCTVNVKQRPQPIQIAFNAANVL